MEIRTANNKRCLTNSYGSPSQGKDQFDGFCSSFNMLMSNINDEKTLVFIITEVFNARSNNWWSYNITNGWLLPAYKFPNSFD